MKNIDLLDWLSLGRCVVNLINTMAGAAFLSMAFNVARLGIFGFTVALVVVAYLNYWSLDELGKVWLATPEKIKNNPAVDFFDLPDYLKYYSRGQTKVFSVIYNVITFLSMFGTLCFYVIVSRTCLEVCINAWRPGTNKRTFTIVFGVVFGVLTYATTMVKRLHYQSIFSFFSVGIVIAVMVACVVDGAGDRLEYIQPPFSLDGLFPLGSIFFAFTCQMNAMPIYDDLRSPTPGRIRAVNVVSIVIITTVFFLFGYFGFAAQGANADPNVLLGFDSGPAINLLVSIKMLLTYPLIARPMLVSTEELIPSRLLGWGRKALWSVLSAVAVAASVTIGCVFEDISQVTSLVGAGADGLISFFFPAVLVLLTLRPLRKKTDTYSSDSSRTSSALALANLSLGLTAIAMFGFLAHNMHSKIVLYQEQ